MKGYHKTDSMRISGITGDNRSDTDLESIIGMPLPQVHAKEVKPRKKAGKESTSEKIAKIDPPTIYDKKITLELPTREAAREFSSAFNYSLAAHFNGRERQYESGDPSYHHRGIRFLAIYVDYCEKHRLVLKRSMWNGDNTVTVCLSNRKSRALEPETVQETEPPDDQMCSTEAT